MIKPSSVSDIKIMLENALRFEHKLNEWEQRFCADMRDRVRRGVALTQPMVDKIEEIHIKLP